MRGQESEKTLEARLRREIERRGGLCLKYTSQFHRGIPDRIVLMPGGFTAFAEMKSTGERPTPIQARAIERLRRLGFPVFVIDSTGRLDVFLAMIDNLTEA